jgi:hypothetical protein
VGSVLVWQLVRHDDVQLTLNEVVAFGGTSEISASLLNVSFDRTSQISHCLRDLVGSYLFLWRLGADFAKYWTY